MHNARFRRTEEPLQQLQCKPSRYISAAPQVRSVPGEPVRSMMEQPEHELFMFSTQTTRTPKGATMPLAKFEESLVRTGQSEQERFYSGNMAELIGSRLH